MDGGLRRVARLGLRRLRRPAVQLRRSQLRADAARAADRLARRAQRHPVLDRSPHVAPPDRLGHRRHHLRQGRRPPGPDAHAAPHDADLLGRHRPVRHRPQHLDAGGVPLRRQPRHRRRVGGRRLDGRRGRAREAADRGRRAPLHLGAVRAGAGHPRQLRRGRPAVPGSSRGLLALRVPERPAPGRRGAPGPVLRQGTGALGVQEG